MSIRKVAGVVSAIYIVALFFYIVSSAAKPAVEDDEEKAREAYLQKVEEKKQEINGTKWNVQFKAQHGTKMTMRDKDTIYFQDGKFRSDFTAGKDFSPTNYTITVRDSGSTTFETMQTSNNPDEGIVFWRGEWLDKAMTGTMVRKVPDAPNESYYFSNTGFEEIAPSVDGSYIEPKPAVTSSAEKSSTAKSRGGFRWSSLISKEKR